MNAAQLMSDLARLGIRIEADGDRLRYWPRSAVTPDLFGRMKAFKLELLSISRHNREATAVARTVCELPQQSDASDFIDANDWYWENIDEADRERLLGPRNWPSPCAWCGGRTVHSAACDELRRGWIPVFSFGKYRGRRADTVPRQYIDWVLRKKVGDDEFRSDLRRWRESGRTESLRTSGNRGP